MKYTPSLEVILKEVNLSMPTFKMIYCIIIHAVGGCAYITSKGTTPSAFSEIVILSYPSSSISLSKMYYRPFLLTFLPSLLVLASVEPANHLRNYVVFITPMKGWPLGLRFSDIPVFGLLYYCT